MSTDVELTAAPPTARPRRLLASAVASSYGIVLFIAWFNPLLMVATHEPDRPLRTLSIALGVSFIAYVVTLLLIPRRYYKIQPFEQDGRLYRRLGVRQFRYIVGEGEGIQQLSRRIDPQWQSTLSKLSCDERIKWTQTAEWIHIGMIFLSLPLIILAYRREFTTFATLYLLSNIPFNIYPILLQRYTRAKRLRICNLQSNRLAIQNG